MSGRRVPAGSTVRLRRLGQILLVPAIVASTIFSSSPMGASADSGVCAIPGFDGPGGTLSGIVNTYYPGSATAAAGLTSISVGSPSGSATAIAAGDLLLVIQMPDAEIDSTNSDAYGDGGVGDPATGSTNLNNAGRYEYVVALGPVAAGSVPIVGDGSGGGLVYAYTDAAATLTQGQRRFQVIRVPQYSTATLSSTLTALQWNGTVGGVLAIDVAGTLTLGGTVSVDALGFRGGGGRQVAGSAGFLNTDYRTPSTSNPNGSKGEGIAGTPMLFYDGTSVGVNTSLLESYPNGAMARGAPGNVGGGGTDGNPAANDQNSGGGGGGNGGAGGLGGFSWNSILSVGGFGGAAFSVAAPDRLVLGAGGGAGSRNNTPGVAGASSGGVGGGMVMIRAGTIAGTGTISANGGSGVVPDNDGSGGGGAGGSVLLTSQTWSPTSLTVSAVGGAGANNWILQPPGTPGEFDPGGGNARHGPGGGGGGGVVLLTSAVNTTTSVSGGAAGTTTTAASNFGAQPGAAGVVSTTVTDGQVTTGISGVLCLPILTVTKTTSTPGPMSVPNTATYTISVSNAAGRGAATGVNLSDTLPAGFTYSSNLNPVYAGGATGPAVITNSGTAAVPVFGVAGGDSTNSFSVPGGGSVSLTFTVSVAASVPQGTYQNPAVTNYTDPTRTAAGQTITPGGAYASGGGTAGGSNYDPASSTGEDVQISATPSLNVVKSETSSGPYGVGDPITYDLVVTNTGNVTLTNVTVSDPQATVGVCAPAQPGSLAPLASMTCPASYVVTQADLDAGSFTNTATADSTETGPDTDSETVTLTQTPSLNVVKSETSSGPNGVGDPITYDLVVTNTGNVTLTNVTVSDPQATVGVCAPVQPGTLAPLASMTCPASYGVTQADLDAGSFTNTATADSSETGPDTDDETVTFTQSPALNVTKSETSTGPYGVGDPITYDLVVTNTGNVTLTNVTVSDPQATVGVCAPVQPGTLAPLASMTCPASYGVTQADLDAGSFTNTATADSSETGPDTDDETVTFTQSPALNVTKSETSTGPYGVGDPITYDLVVTNTGNVTLTNVTVSDPQATVGVCAPVQPGTLAPLASMTCPASYGVTQADLDAGSFTNTATADSSETGPDTDDETVTFTQSPALNVTKSETSTGPYGVGKECRSRWSPYH